MSGEFVGGCDILLGSKSWLSLQTLESIFTSIFLVHQSGELEKLLASKNIIPPEDSPETQKQTSSP